MRYCLKGRSIRKDENRCVNQKKSKERDKYEIGTIFSLGLLCHNTSGTITRNKARMENFIKFKKIHITIDRFLGKIL